MVKLLQENEVCEIPPPTNERKLKFNKVLFLMAKYTTQKQSEGQCNLKSTQNFSDILLSDFKVIS